jgi:hypothetical protein
VTALATLLSLISDAKIELWLNASSVWIDSVSAVPGVPDQRSGSSLESMEDNKVIGYTSHTYHVCLDKRWVRIVT